MPNGGLLNLKPLPELPIKLCAESLLCSFTKDARSENVKRLLLPPTTLERTHDCPLQDSEGTAAVQRCWTWTDRRLEGDRATAQKCLGIQKAAEVYKSETKITRNV